MKEIRQLILVEDAQSGDLDGVTLKGAALRGRESFADTHAYAHECESANKNAGQCVDTVANIRNEIITQL